MAISTSGTSPAYARQLRGEIEMILPDQIGPILTRMGNLRSEVSERIPDQKVRATAYRIILAALIESENKLTDQEIEVMIDEMEHSAP